MDSLTLRYGENLTLPIDTGDYAAVSADIFIGKPGEVYVLTKHADLTLGKGVFNFSRTDTQLPLDTYNYQINVNYANDYVEKFPDPTVDDDTFPTFTVGEALDATEVVS